jgi:hypothetical protein
MKLAYSRRYRRSTSRTRETAVQKKEGPQEQLFFAAPSDRSFFKPSQTIQRKCAHCDAEDKNVQRAAFDKEDEKKIHREEEKKEEPVQKKDDRSGNVELQRAAEHKEEEKIQKKGDKKEEEKVQREPEKKEEEKIHKMEDKKEEKDVHRTADQKEEDKHIAKKESGPSDAGSAKTSAYIHSLPGKGSPLPKEAQQFFGKRMAHDFSEVRIHTGTEAEQSAKNVNAKAYTTGYNIVFNKNQYNPASADGKKLLAHELTHVVQQKGNDPEWLNRVAQLTEKKKEEGKPVSIVGRGTKTRNKTSHGCAGVDVQGQTDANYSSSFKSTGASHTSTECTDCAAPDCITIKGSVISAFKAKPVISLPSVPDGLSRCEANAVRIFINGTLRRHEQQHVSAFKTYNGTIRTPFEYTGCRAGLDSLIQSIHDGIDMQRMANANALSDALDPFNATIPCNCK